MPRAVPPFIITVALLASAVTSADAQRPAASLLRPTTASRLPPPLPPVPLLLGPLDLRVAYPPSGAPIAARDSNFIFGQTGTGRASLTINGRDVPVAPDGAWMAYLPLTGHPPLGAVGPTGLKEADANLGVALALRRVLVRAGARVLMTRTTDTAIGLYERTTLADRGGAELLVSIHNNAFPDGVNPFENSGTSAYYFQPRAVRLAMLVQDGMVRRMGLRNLGIGRGDLALVRPTWMPAVLCEGAFLMIPQQEHALRTPSFQERYARGVADGIEAFLRELAEGGPADGRTGGR